MLNDQDLDRYSRQVILPQITEEGQEKLFRAKLLLVGLGGLGCPAATYLALAGVGQIALVDDDVIEASNLPRQTLFEEADIGRPKAEAAAEKLSYLNSSGHFTAYHQRFDSQGSYGEDSVIWLDASDSYTSRAEVALAAGQQKKILITAAAQAFQGQVATLYSGADDACFHGLYPSSPQENAVSRCEQVGILGTTVGIIGTMLAQEAIRELLGLEGGLRNRVLLYDGLFIRMQKMALQQRRKDCQICK